LESLNHTNIIGYKHSWLEEGKITENSFGPTIPCLFILMEYANYGNLESYIEKNILSEDEIWKFFTDILMGLNYLHSSDIIHRDLKPGNLVLHNYFDRFSLKETIKVMITDFWYKCYCKERNGKQ